MHDHPSATDELVEAAQANAATFAGSLSVIPKRHIAIVACMDARLDLFRIFGLAPGDAHVIRNAGGIATDDVLRSLVVSQHFLQTREIVLLQHTNCGLQQMNEAEFRDRIASESGSAPPYTIGAFADPADSVRRSIARIKEHIFLPHRERVRGFVYDVTSGAAREVL